MRRAPSLAFAVLFAFAAIFVTGADVKPPCPGKSCKTPEPTIAATPTAAPTIAPTPTPPPTTSPFTFAEECSGPGLGAAWSSLLGPGDPGDRLDTDMMGDLRQVSVAGGICTITVERKQTPSGRPFAGAVPATYGTFGQKYGTWEARFRYDVAQGTWPSWFLLPVGQRGPFPEIDAVEAYGDTECLGPNLFEHVIWPSSAGSIYTIVSRPDGWHTFRFTWTAARVDFYVDDQPTWSVTDPTKVPQVAMYPIFIYGVGAPLAACRANASTPDVLHMDIDWLRVAP